MAADGTSGASNGQSATTPYDVAAWWGKYLLLEGGVLLDCLCGSGTILTAGLDYGAKQVMVIGFEKEKEFIKIIEKRIVGG